MANTPKKGIVTIIVIIALAVIAWGILTMQDRRTTGEKVGEAIDALPDAGKAAEKLENQTPGERLGDAVEDMGEDIKEKTDR